MRENMGVYRGKRKDNGEWVEGSLLYDSEQNESYIAKYFEDKAAYIREVIPETVEECTGLPDKNGKKIFEGDILRCGNIKGVVKYSNKRATFTFKWKRFSLHGGDFFKECGLANFGEFSSLEIIGNIHDNPELLEVSEDD